MDIKKKIKELGRTQVDVANALGMSKANFGQQVNNLETNMAVNLLQNIAKELGISVSELIGEEATTPSELTIKMGSQEITYKRED